MWVISKVKVLTWRSMIAPKSQFFSLPIAYSYSILLSLNLRLTFSCYQATLFHTILFLYHKNNVTCHFMPLNPVKWSNLEIRLYRTLLIPLVGSSGKFCLQLQYTEQFVVQQYKLYFTTPWTGHQSITRPHRDNRDKQSFKLKNYNEPNACF